MKKIVSYVLVRGSWFVLNQANLLISGSSPED
jgi:hypothetical protein